MSGPAHLIGMTAAAAVLSYAPTLASVDINPSSQAAALAYGHYASGQAEAAVIAALRAVEEEPTNLDYRLLLADSLTLAGRPSEALEVLVPRRDQADYRVQSRLAQAAWNSREPDLAAQAFGAAADLADTGQARAYLSRAAVLALLEAGRRDEAVHAFDAAWSNQALQGFASLDTANVALAVGRDAQALWAFEDAQRTAPLTGLAALNAGYAAQRLGRPEWAANYFHRALSDWPAEVDPARRAEIEAFVHQQIPSH
jgi:tetratricopeptide (TPR) repeat protein